MTDVVIASRLAADEGHGGHAWAVLNWVLGAEACGYRVHLIEPAGATQPVPSARTLSWALTALRRNGFLGSYTVVGPAASWTHGDLEPDDVRRSARQAAMLLNLSGIWQDEIAHEFTHRVFVDLDPGFTQLWEHQGVDLGLNTHTAFVTVGLDVGTPRCLVPGDGRSWVTTPPPVMMDRWHLGAPDAEAAFTTIANWRSYGTIHHDGVRHGQKAHSFRRFLEVPARSPVRVGAALRIHPDEHDDLTALERHGWPWTDAAELDDPQRYQDHIRASRGELGIAKEGYVVANTGWVSDRSACFLAAGRPVVAQDTGGSTDLADTDGFVRFRTTDEAVERLVDVDRNWCDHSRGARELARRRFAHDVVVPNVVEATT